MYVGLTRPIESIAIVFNDCVAFNPNGIKVYSST